MMKIINYIAIITLPLAVCLEASNDNDLEQRVQMLQREAFFQREMAYSFAEAYEYELDAIAAKPAEKLTEADKSLLETLKKLDKDAYETFEDLEKARQELKDR